MKLLNYDGDLSKSLNTLFDLTILNLIWLLCCIPIITIGAATSAQYSSLKKYMNGDRHIFINYTNGFKDHFIQSTQIWIPFAVLSFIFYFSFGTIFESDITGKSFLIILVSLAYIFFLFIILWVFPIIATFKGNILELVFNAVAFSFIYIPFTIIGFGLYGLLGYGFLHYSIARVFIIVIGFSVIAYINLLLFNFAFKRQQEKQQPID